MPAARRPAVPALAAVVLALVVSASVAAAAPGPLQAEGPVAAAFDVGGLARVPRLAALPVDREAARTEDVQRDREGLPPRFALPQAVAITPETDGVWQDLDARWVLWRLRITAPGATSLNLGFDRYRLPKNARLTIAPADAAGPDPRGVRIFTERDNKPHGQLWTPVVLSDDIVVELLLPAESRHDYALEIASVNRGYRGFDEMTAAAAPDKSGLCNVDVVCPEGDPWRLEINAVGVYSTGGTLFCTGAMLNNTARDGTPYFLTADHCGITDLNAASMVVYWNFQSPTCGAHGGGTLDDYQAGATFLAASDSSDFTLLLLDDPVNPAHEVSFAGWDHGGADAVSSTCIHHPNTDEKSISFDYDPSQVTSLLGTTVPGDGFYVRVVDWDVGTTEPGSSGAPLFDQDHHVIGQLTGGYAECGNNESDYFGRFARTYPHISHYLDPLGIGVVSLDTYAPWATGIVVQGATFAATGNEGGPFTPATGSWLLVNQGATPLDYQVTSDAAWAEVVAGASGTLAAGASTTVTVAVGAAADVLPNGVYAGSLAFTNLTDGDGDTVRGLSLVVGVPSVQYAFPFDSDPGWTTEGDWAFGVPAGGGGEHGSPDPTSGFTGANVYGYNLAGDYPNNLPETHLTSTAIDCSALGAVTVSFRRWLNVEQPAYDHASFSVSNDGVNFTRVWANVAGVEDAAWTQVSYDIGAWADGQPTVYLRWTMGTTDFSWAFSGWNIDDVEIRGIHDSVSAVGDAPAAPARLGNFPNPFNPLTRVTFALEREGPATLAVYDLQGRRVRLLASGRYAAGEHAVVWDGADQAGRPVGSGVYFARLAADGQVVRHKMVMLK